MLTITPGRQQYDGGNGPTSRAPCVDPRVAAAQHFYGYAAAAAVSAMLQRNGTYVDGSNRRALERLTANATGVAMTHLKRVAAGSPQVENLSNKKLRQKLRRQRQRENKAGAAETKDVASKVTTPKGVHEASASKCDGGWRVAAGDEVAARVAGLSQTDANKSQDIASKEASNVATQVTTQARAVVAGAAGKQSSELLDTTAAVTLAGAVAAITITGVPDADAVARWQQKV